MEISLLALQVAIIFLPGIVWARLDATYGSRSRPSEQEFALRALMFGLASYALTFVAFAAAGRSFSMIDLNGGNTAILTPAIAVEIVCALGVSLLAGLLWLYATNYKLLTRVLLRIGATRVYGDEDVWDFALNTRNSAVEYVQLRDFEKRIVYAGWVDTFSETGKLRELILSNAQVYDFAGNLLFEMPYLYLARNPEDIHIEFPLSDSRKEREP